MALALRSLGDLEAEVRFLFLERLGLEEWFGDGGGGEESSVTTPFVFEIHLSDVAHGHPAAFGVSAEQIVVIGGKHGGQERGYNIIIY